MKKKKVVFGALGTVKDGHKPRENRWNKWRPTVGLCLNENFPVSRYELFHQAQHEALAGEVKHDVESKGQTEVNLYKIDFGGDPWNLEKVYGAFFDFFVEYPFDNKTEDYYVNISTGTHVMQICLFLLTEARYVPAHLVQSTENRKKPNVIDLDLEQFDIITRRLRRQQSDDIAFLKDYIDTKNSAVELLLKKLQFIASNYHYPILLTGRTGVGKTSLADRIHQLRKEKNLADGDFVAVNCGTLSGDTVKSELFGHEKGAFTGAEKERKGLLELANNGTLFLDEIGELNLEVQKMLLTAIEDKKFRRLGATTLTISDFYLIAGTNSNLHEKVRNGQFREDLLARIDAFHFLIPSLKERPEDIEPNFNRELQLFSQRNNKNVTIVEDAKKRYLEFARSTEAIWKSNFRDLKSSVIRMAAYAKKGRITRSVVDDEIECLRDRWCGSDQTIERFPLSRQFIAEDKIRELDLVDLAQLELVIEVCGGSATRGDAGRALFNASRLRKQSKNDTARLNNYLKSHGLDWHEIRSTVT